MSAALLRLRVDLCGSCRYRLFRLLLRVRPVDALEALHVWAVVAAAELVALLAGAEHCCVASVGAVFLLRREAGEAAHVVRMLALVLPFGLIIIANVNVPGRTGCPLLLLRQLHPQNGAVAQVDDVSQPLAALDVQSPPTFAGDLKLCSGDSRLLGYLDERWLTSCSSSA